MSITELKQNCSDWNECPKDFSRIVLLACTLAGLNRELSTEFEVATSTVSRWATGTAVPLPRMQRLIVESIKLKLP